MAQLAMRTTTPIFRCPIPRSIAWCAAAIIAVAGCRFSPSLQTLSISGPTMGTSYSVKVAHPPRGVDEQALKEEIDAALDRIDALMSTYKPDSELSRLNRSKPNEWFSVSPEVAAVIDEAIRIGQLTDGAFDVTVGPLVNLWNFGPERSVTARTPSDAQIRRAARRVGLEHVDVRLSPPAVKKRQEDLYIDLSGIAKGFAVDRIAELLDRRGIEDYLVEVGGELKAKGHKRPGRPWQVAVESPVAGERAIQKVIALEDLAMATSGDYRNFFEEDSIRYSHIIDPRSARPVTHRFGCVTVLDASCMRADALATALMVLGPDAGYKLAIQENLPALFIVKDTTGFVEKATPPFKKLLQ